MPKTKISVTVDSVLVEEIDRVSTDVSRSEVVEMALASWLRNRRSESLERAVEEYYRGLTEAERTEDSEWATLSGRAVDKIWK
jgi:metal-responsive CopG/Arc/MetJ family transcriptional regulator